MPNKMSGTWPHKHAGNRKVYMKQILLGYEECRWPIKLQTLMDILLLIFFFQNKQNAYLKVGIE